MQTDALKNLVVEALEEMKAVDLKALDVRNVASFTDYMVIASGTSDRHVKALADKLIEKCKQAGARPLGIEGERQAEWILIDLGDIVAHIMKPDIRDFYNLEKLWSVPDTASSNSVHAT